MWYTLHDTRHRNTELEPIAQELLERTSRTVMLAISGSYLLWMLLMGVIKSDEFTMRTSIIGATILLFTIAASRLVTRNLTLSQILWQAGLMLAITLGIYIFEEPTIALLYMLVPLITAITLGWQISLITCVIIVSMVLWLFPNMSPEFHLDSKIQTVIIAGGTVSSIMGWGATHAWFSATLWAFDMLYETRARLQEAFAQRLELNQTQEDLLQANQELARMSERLRIVNQSAEEARQAKQRFVANVSHELRTPLNMIIGFAEMIPQLSTVYGTELPPALLSDIDAIRRNSQHLSRLVDDVLDLSQMDAGRMALTKEWCRIEDILNEAIAAVRVLYQSKNLVMDLDIAEDLPSIFCDRTRIRQVVLNLLSNAGRFTSSGGVVIAAYIEQAYLKVCVTDTGPGISAEKLNRLFEPFEQLDGSIRRQYGGTGLGLSISKQFVEMHDGQMTVDSALGKGTTFCFMLPVNVQAHSVLNHDDARRWFNPYESAEYRQRTRRPKTVLPEMKPRFVLVDEGEELQRLFMHYEKDVEVVSLDAVEAVVSELAQAPAQAVIINTPPDESASQLAHYAAQLPYNIPAFSCWVPGNDAAAHRLGIAAYLLKPISRERLTKAIQALDRPVKTILLVDDQPEALRLFTRMLSSVSDTYTIIQTTNGQRALSLMRSRNPDVVLLDLVMPGLDGFEVIQQMHTDPVLSDIPVLVISSLDPAGEPIVSNSLSVVKGGGFSGRDLLTCIGSLSAVIGAGAAVVPQALPEAAPD